MTNDDDGWTHVADATCIPRDTVKTFLIKFMAGEGTILELAKEFKLSAVQIAHINMEFSIWTGAE